MKLEQLRALSREWLDDDSVPPLWDDDVLDRHLNEALREAAVRARMLLDYTTPEVCEISLVAGQGTYTLPAPVILIQRAATDLNPDNPLTRVHFAVLEDSYRGWKSAVGTPQYLVQNLERRKFTLVPAPVANDTLRLNVIRYPLESELLVQKGDVPPIDEIQHEALVHWACYRAYLKKDSEKYSPDDAAVHYSQFEQVFGKKLEARALQALCTEPTTSTQSYFF